MKNNHKSPLSLIMLLLGSVMLAGCQQQENDMSESTFDASSDVESASYLIGFRQAQNIQQQGGDIIDMQAYGQGARDAIAGQESQVPVENEEQLMGALTDALMQQKAASSESFMQENAARAERRPDEYHKLSAAIDDAVNDGNLRARRRRRRQPRPSATAFSRWS